MIAMEEQTILYENTQKVFESFVGKDVLIVYSPTSLFKATAKNIVDSKLFFSFVNLPISSKLARVSYDSLESSTLDHEIYVGFGGGTVIDIAKFLSYKHKGSKCIAIPTMLSTNVFATNKVAAIRSKGKQTENSKLPEEVVFDESLLRLSMKENLQGLTDAFSIYTALQDWVIANALCCNTIDKNIYQRAEIIFNTAFNIASNPEIIDIFHVLKESGYITNDYGNGTPESGSEHIIAKEIENLVQVPHALSVTCGITIASLLQRNYNEAVAPLKRSKIFYEIKDSVITPEILKQALKNVKPRPDRCTVINVYNSFNEDEIDMLISESGLYV